MRTLWCAHLRMGQQWESKEPVQYEDVPNYVPDKYASKMTNEVNQNGKQADM